MTQILLKLPKRRGAYILAQICDFKGTSFLDIREWVPRDTDLVATRKGVTVPLESIPLLAEALSLVGIDGPASPDGDTV